VIKSWVNGRVGDRISVLDRGLLYGQTVFETISVFDQQPLLLNAHLDRLKKGCKVLAIPLDQATLVEEIESVCDQTNKGVLRITISMGEGGRGYQNPEIAVANRIMSLHDFPHHPIENWQSGIELGLSEVRLADQPALAGIKHGNRLEQILARTNWSTKWQEAVLLNQHGQLIEATQSNVFLRSGSALKTPDLNLCGVNGVMRDFVIDNAEKIATEVQIVPLSMTDIETADEVFVTNSIIGLWPVKTFLQSHYSDFTVSQKLLDLMQDHGAIPTL